MRHFSDSNSNIFLFLAEVTRVNSNPQAEAHIPIRHDILEVNNYFVSGLATSELDLWFQGEIPQFAPRELGVPSPDDGPLDDVLDRAMQPVMRSSLIEWQEVCDYFVLWRDVIYVHK